MKGVRDFIQTRGGFAAAGILLIVAAALFYFLVAGNGDAALEAATKSRLYICSETGKTFQHSLTLGESNPVISPYNNRPTGFPAELCYWTKEGVASDVATPVLLKEAAGQAGPTFCPNCGRLVVAHNPTPAQASAAPPTAADYKLRHSAANARR